MRRLYRSSKQYHEPIITNGFCEQMPKYLHLISPILKMAKHNLSRIRQPRGRLAHRDTAKANASSRRLWNAHWELTPKAGEGILLSKELIC